VRTGEKLTLTFAIHNPTWHTARVVNLTETCGKNCCFRVVTQLKPFFDLPAGGVVTLDCSLETFEPGPFAGQMHIFRNLWVYPDSLGSRRGWQSHPATIVTNPRLGLSSASGFPAGMVKVQRGHYSLRTLGPEPADSRHNRPPHDVRPSHFLLHPVTSAVPENLSTSELHPFL